MASQTATFSGLADFSSTGAAQWWHHYRRTSIKKVDIKRALAIGAVVIGHTMLLGALLLPSKPMGLSTTLAPPVETYIDPYDVVKPPPLPELPVVKITSVNDPKPTIAPTPAPPAPMPPVETTATATTVAALESSDVVAPTIPSFVDPAPTGGGDPVESALIMLDAPPPIFPSFARKSATVEFRVLVNVDGIPERVELVKSSGNRRLDQHTLGHIKRRWRFKAPEVDGVPVQGWGRGKISYALDG
jgi:periplasmic protein TonB